MLNRNSQLHMECLEDRQMMAVNALMLANGASLYGSTNVPVAEAVSFVRPSDAVGSRPTEAYIPSESELDINMGLPLLDSNLGAPYTIHLDFTGSSQASFANHNGTFPKNGVPIVTPAFDSTYDPTVFSAQEQEQIRQIWARVAEDFAPFNVNVTTHYYGELTNGKVLKVAIGGHPTDWYINWEESSATPSGTSSVGSFTDPAKPNVVFVFSQDISFGVATGERDNDFQYVDMVAATANTASHEAGHAFGLEHLAKYVSGKKVDDYDGGDAEWTPIMGDNLASDRTTWASGKTDKGALQHDFQKITSILGLRPDDHANGRVGATSLAAGATAAKPLTAKGIIEWQADVDFFKFTSTGGQVRVEINAAQFGPNLWLKADLWNETGFVASGQFGASNFQTLINANIPAGTYYVLVRGYGAYGHLGQYNVKVSHLLANVQNVNSLGGTVGPVGPADTGKGTLPTVKGVTLKSGITGGKNTSGDANSNPVVYSTASTGSKLVAADESKKKRSALPLGLSLELKDAAFAKF